MFKYLRNNSGNAVLGGLSLIFIIIVALLAITAIGLWFYGAYLAFSASIIIGVICLFLVPLNTISGVLMYFWNYNLPEALQNTINLPF